MCKKLSLLLIIQCILVACASPVPTQRAALENTQRISLISQLKPKPITLEKTVRSTITSNSPVVSINGYRTYAELFVISKPLVTLNVHLLGDCECLYAPTAYWLFPRVTILDSEFNPVTNGPELSLNSLVGSFNRKLIIEGTLKVENTDEKTLYVLVHTAPELLKKAVAINTTSNQITVIGGVPYYSGTNSSSSIIPASPVGTYELTLLPQNITVPAGNERKAPTTAMIVNQGDS